MKKQIYIFLAIILWGLLGLLLCGLLEIAVFRMLFADFLAQQIWLSWPTWFVMGKTVMAVFLVAGLFSGYFFGQRWWQIIYVEKRYRGFFKKRSQAL